MTQNKPVLPGGVIGVLGGGQLGRMLALAAKRMGYRVHVYTPERDSPAGQVADMEFAGEYEDLERVRQFASGVDVVTFEFENVPAATSLAAAELTVVRPHGHVLHVAQNRIREKRALVNAGIPVASFAEVHSAADVSRAVDRIGVRSVLKTAESGYDGKGQRRVSQASDAAEAWQTFGGVPCVLEQWVEHVMEFSVVAARSVSGEIVDYGVIENEHRHHILDVSVWPARIPSAFARQARQMAHAILEALDVVGVMCVEFFLAADGRVLVNELAPRPHNSGHLTIEACVTSQFEQQLRAVCGLPLGSTEPVKRAAAMVNLLGDIWSDGEPAWAEVLAMHGAHLHLYGKSTPAPGRKMGHITVTADSTAEAVAVARAAREALRSAGELTRR